MPTVFAGVGSSSGAMTNGTSFRKRCAWRARLSQMSCCLRTFVGSWKGSSRHTGLS